MTDDLLDETLPDVPDGYRRMEWFQGFGRQIGPIYERLEDGAEGAYTLAFPVCDHHTNGMGNCHGGMLMSFADMAFGRIISVKARRYWVTVRLLTDFVSGAKKGEWVEGGSVIENVENDFYSVRGRIWCGDRTIMTGSAIFKALGVRPPRK